MNPGILTSKDNTLQLITLEELASVIEQVARKVITEALEKRQPEKFLSVAEVCNMFSPRLSRGTLLKWRKEGIIEECRIDGKLLFRYTEVIQAVQKINRFKKYNYEK